MKNLVLAVVCTLVLSNFSNAGCLLRGRAKVFSVQAVQPAAVKKETKTTTTTTTTTTTSASSAQGVANLIVVTGRFRHFGGYGGFEGIGMGSTPAQAEANCCFRSRMIPRERGFAQLANGMWVCCCRY